MHPAVRYFDLNEPIASRRPAPKEEPKPAAGTMPLWEQILMYLGIFLGVLLSSALQQFKAGQPLESLDLSLATVALAAVVALILIPVVYDKLQVKADAPFIYRFALFVQHGVFWQVVFDAMAKLLK